MKKNILKELKYRKLIVQISNKKKIKKYLKKKNISIYCGFDPTYKSLHIGHLIPLLTLKRFVKYNYKVFVLIGKFTSKIGDPSFQKNKRKKNKNLNFSNKIINQIKNILGKKINIIKNSKWYNNMKLSFFLNKIGNNFIVNKILNKEAIKIRNLNNKKGINFKELSYPLLQSYDFLYLYKKKNTIIQIGGSDQWGNITSGINLIKKKLKKRSFGITLPLITKKNGIKHSKSFSNTIWLDKNKTSIYEFYQFWLNIPDNKVIIYLKQLTWINIKRIEYLNKNININKIKKILANKITEIVYNKKYIKDINLAINIFFKKKNINKKKLTKLYKKSIPKINIINKIKKLKKILILLNIVNNKSQVHNLIKSLSIKINFNIIKNTEYKIKSKDKLFNKFTILQKGKKKFFLIKWI